MVCITRSWEMKCFENPSQHVGGALGLLFHGASEWQVQMVDFFKKKGNPTS